MLPKHTCTSHTFCSTVHNAHAYAQPCPHKSFSSQHACHNFYLLTNSTCAAMYPLLFTHQLHQRFLRFKRAQRNICIEEKNHSVCKNALEKEREREVYTHRSREYGNGFFSFVSERYNQILPYSYDFYFGGEGAYHFLILIKTTTPSNFLVFFIIYTYTLQK